MPARQAVIEKGGPAVGDDIVRQNATELSRPQLAAIAALAGGSSVTDAAATAASTGRRSTAGCPTMPPSSRR
jgi:hypothetical protein